MNLYYRLSFFLFFISNALFASWNTVNIGNTDKLNAVYFFDVDAGIIAGNQGVYYTSTGGKTAGAWTRYNTFQTTADATTYSNCHFYKIASKEKNIAYICGEDTVNHKAVILYLNITTATASFVYTGATGSALNDIKFNYNNAFLYAVGNKGLFVRSDLTTYTETPTKTTHHLHSIFIKNNNAAVHIAGDHVYMRATDTGSAVTFAIHLQPYDMISIGGDPYDVNRTYGVGNAFYSTYSTSAFTTVAENTNYDFGPLNARSIVLAGVLRIATSHGIFVSSNSNTVLDYQPSSNGLSLNHIYFLGNQDGFSVGDKGVFLYTSDGGGAEKPYCYITSLPGCAGEASELKGITSNVSNCKWLVNKKQISTDCQPTHTFTNIGIDTIQYVVGNTYGLYDTATKIVFIVTAPLTHFPVSVVDSILCQSEQITVFIDSTQSAFTYNLHKYSPSATYFGSVNGNDAKDSIRSTPIDSTGFYYVSATSILSPGCFKPLSDTLKLQVEHTKGKFHVAAVNANKKEGVTYFAKSKDATHFDWTFSLGGKQTHSLLKNPVNISFSDTGYVQVKLISTSDYGCTDTITGKGAYTMIEPLSQDTCWVDYTDGIDTTWQGVDNNRLTRNFHLLPDDSYLLSGGYRQQVFRGRYGKTIGRTKENGGYLAKYSANETLKWLVRNKWSGSISDHTTDAGGNIYYAAGECPTCGFTHFNNGDSMKLYMLEPKYNSVTTVVKMDSLGAYLWHVQLEDNNNIIDQLKTDHDNNVIIKGRFMNKLTFRSSDTVQVLLDVPSINSIDRHTFFMKLSPTGKVIWATYFYNDSYFNSATDFDFDKQNNIYIVGEFNRITFFSADTTKEEMISLPSTSELAAFAVKYNSDGRLLWKSSARTYSISKSTANYAVRSDGNNNLYITGSNGVYMPGDYMELTDAKGGTHKISNGAYFFLKLTSQGDYKWCVGSTLAYHGSGQSLSIQNNRIVVSCGAGDLNNAQTWYGALTSASGSEYPVSLARTDFFLVEYDTLGNINWITKGGNDKPGQNTAVMPNQLEFNSKGYLVFKGKSGFQGNSTNATIFGDQVFFNGEDCFIGKTGIKPCADNLIVTDIKQDVATKLLTVKVGPNPFSDYLKIETATDDSFEWIRIYDVLGKSVLEKEVKGSIIVIEKNELPVVKGIYFLKYKTKEGEGSIKICN